MNVDNDRFLEEGIKRYAEARDTIASFEAGMGRIVEQAVKNRNVWRPLKEAKIGRVMASRSSEYGHWMAVAISGSTPQIKKAVIDCGLWWESGRVTGDSNIGPIIYASYYDAPKHVMGFAWNKKGSDICSFQEWERTFLYLPLKKPADIGEGLNRLLSVLLKQLDS